MPKLFKADLLAPGPKHCRNPLTGEDDILDVTPDYQRRLVQQFRETKAAGIRTPVLWGHQFKRGNHGQNADDLAADRARYMAGDVEDIIENEDGTLQMIATVPPGCEVDDETQSLINPTDHTRIKEVSIGIGDLKHGGTGQKWSNAVVHVALTPLPVFTGQSGIRSVPDDFKVALSADADSTLKYTLGGIAMGSPLKAKKKPDDTDDDLTPPPEAAVGSDPNAETPKEDAAPLTPDGTAQDEVPNDADAASSGNPMDEGTEAEAGDGDGDEEGLGEGGEDPNEAIAEQATELLNELGIPMPEGTQAANYLSVIVGVLAGLKAANARITVGGEHDLEPVAGLEKAQVGQAPLFTLSMGEANTKEVSTLTPLEAALGKATAEEARQKRHTRLDAINKAGIPAHITDGIRANISTVSFALSNDTVIATLPEADHDIGLLELVVEAIGPMLVTYALTNDPDTTEEVSPIPDSAPRQERRAKASDETAHKEWLQKQAKSLYGPQAQLQN